MPTLVLYDADNVFSGNDVLAAVKALPAQDCLVCAAGAHAVAHRIGTLAAGLDKAGVRHAHLRIVTAGEDAADDVLVDFALRWRQNLEGPLYIQVFTQDKGLINRLDCIASTQIGCVHKPPSKPPGTPFQTQNLPDDEFFKRFLAALNLKTASSKQVRLRSTDFSQCACNALGLIGADKSVKKLEYAKTIERLKQAGVIAASVKQAPFAVNVNVLRQVVASGPPATTTSEGHFYKFPNPATFLPCKPACSTLKTATPV